MIEETVNFKHNEASTSFNPPGLKKTIKEFFFAGFYSIYEDCEMATVPSVRLKHKVVVSVVSGLHGLQLASFAFKAPTFGVEHLLGFSRVDYVFMHYNQAQTWFWFTTAAVLAAVLILLWQSYRACSGSSSRWLASCYWLSLPYNISLNLLFLPMICILVVYLKYTGTTNLSEYCQLATITEEFQFQWIVSGSILLLLVVLMHLETTLHYRQDKRQSGMMARPHSKVEQYRLLGLCLMVVSHFTLHSLVADAHLLGLVVINGSLVGMYIYWLPFYNSFVLHLHVFAYWLGCSASVYKLLALWVETPPLLCFFLIVLTPLHFWVLIHLIAWRHAQIGSHYTQCKTFHSIYQYELLLRWMLENNSESQVTDCEQLFSIMKKRFSTCTMVRLWEYLFTYHVLKDEALANVRLACALEGEFTLETGYKYFCYKKMMTDHPQIYQEEADYIQYRTLLDQARSRDIETSEASIRFWTELLQTRPSGLEELALRLSDRLNAERA